MSQYGDWSWAVQLSPLYHGVELVRASNLGQWSPSLLVEGWMIGLFWGAFFYMRKELRYRFTLEHEGLPLPDGPDD